MIALKPEPVCVSNLGLGPQTKQRVMGDSIIMSHIVRISTGNNIEIQLLSDVRSATVRFMLFR